MDFANAALLIATVVGIVTLARTLIWGDNTERAVSAVVLVAAFATTFLVGATVWAHEQVIGGQTLDNLGVEDKILVAVMLSGGASAAWEVLKSVRNIGQNQPDAANDPPPPAG